MFVVRPQASSLASTNTISMIGAPQPRDLPGSFRGHPLTNSVDAVHVSTGLSPLYTIGVLYLCYPNLGVLSVSRCIWIFVCVPCEGVSDFVLAVIDPICSRQSVSVAPPARPAHREYRGLLCPSCACHHSHCSGHIQALCKQHAC